MPVVGVHKGGPYTFSTAVTIQTPCRIPRRRGNPWGCPSVIRWTGYPAKVGVDSARRLRRSLCSRFTRGPVLA